MLILDGSWYRDTVNALMFGEIDKDEYKRRLKDINTFERQLTDDGTLLIKFFLHITEDEQKARIDRLYASEITRWRVSQSDLDNNANYEKFLRRYDKRANAGDILPPHGVAVDARGQALDVAMPGSTLQHVLDDLSLTKREQTQDAKGKPEFIYLKQDFGGFDIHLAVRRG